MSSVIREDQLSPELRQQLKEFRQTREHDLQRRQKILLTLKQENKLWDKVFWASISFAIVCAILTFADIWPVWLFWASTLWLGIGWAHSAVYKHYRMQLLDHLIDDLEE